MMTMMAIVNKGKAIIHRCGYNEKNREKISPKPEEEAG